MRLVLDTNIYIAAALYNGLTRDIFRMVIKNQSFNLIISVEILQELSSKLADKFHWSEERIEFYEEDIRSIAEIVSVEGELSGVTRDPTDDKILECALSGKADLIVTLDQDLISLKSYRGIGIIHPKTLSWTFPEYFKKS